MDLFLEVKVEWSFFFFERERERAEVRKKRKRAEPISPSPVLHFQFSPALDTRSATVSPLGPPPAMTRSTRPLEGSKLGSSRSSSWAWFSADRARKLFSLVGVAGALATAQARTEDFDVLPPSSTSGDLDLLLAAAAARRETIRRLGEEEEEQATAGRENCLWEK